ncbi:MAG: DUF2779 domain-containing protein [Gammaproteobacteria bacterium]|nr:DUF2779 domain-containing protein [Gammaproteobacteria bacterium]
MYGLSKSKLLAYRQCPKRLWLETHRPDLAEPDDDGGLRQSAGLQVGDVARALHRDGILIEAQSLRACLAQTRKALDSAPRRPLFEATFEHDGVLVRADLLLPARGGHRLVEVKATSEVKDHHIEDSAVQAWVARNAGLKVTHVEVAHIDTAFVYPGGADYAGLFAHVDLTRDAQALAREVPVWVKGARATLSKKKEPRIEPGDQCTKPYPCPFHDYCNGDDDADGYPPEILPHGKTLARSLRAEGYTDLRDVPKGRLAKPHHFRVWQCSVTGKPLLDAGAATLLRGFGYPRYYLDFETINPAVPIWPGTRPYQQVPFQWSCHREAKNGTLRADGFLAADDLDPRRAFMDSLLDAIGDTGPVFVYNITFERKRLEELAADFPKQRSPLKAIIKRLVDLLPITREHYYHPDMRGSWSIKAVLPTIAPELDYGNLLVGDGGMAQQAYLEMNAPETSARRRRQLRDGLLAYCNQDTLAMVRLAHFLQGR